MNKTSFEEIIVRQCSPILAGIKTGNLFSCKMHTQAELLYFVKKINAVLKRQIYYVFTICRYTQSKRSERMCDTLKIIIQKCGNT